MDYLGRIAILKDKDNTYYYFELNEDKVIRVKDNLDMGSHDFRVDSNAYWDVSILEDDLQDNEKEIEYLDIEIAEYLSDELNEIGMKKINDYLVKQLKKEKKND